MKIYKILILHQFLGKMQTAEKYVYFTRISTQKKAGFPQKGMPALTIYLVSLVYSEKYL